MEKPTQTTSSIDSALGSIDRKTFVVIGTTATSHSEILAKAAQAGARYVYMEKPLSQCMKDTDAIREIVKTSGIHFAVGCYNDYTVLGSSTKMLQEKHNLGRLCKIVSDGGAVCLSTNGIHVIDLAVSLFASQPKKAIGHVTSTIGNPRGQDFRIFGGLGYVLFENGGELVLHYSNESINGHTLYLTFEYGMIRAQYFNGKITVFAQETDLSATPKFRYEFPIVVQEIDNTDTLKPLILEIFRNLLNDVTYPGIDRAYAANASLLGILASSHLERPVTLPISKDSPEYDRCFEIT
jgi:predicted dehydrogenase